MSSPSSESKMLLRCSDGIVVEMEKAAAMESKTLKNMIEFVSESSEPPSVNVDSITMLRIISWCEKRIDQSISAVDLEKWDREFVNVDTNALYDLLIASNCLEITVLLNQVCERIADLIKGKTPAEIRRTFNIENDFSKKEGKELRKSYPWAFNRKG